MEPGGSSHPAVGLALAMLRWCCARIPWPHFPRLWFLVRPNAVLCVAAVFGCCLVATNCVQQTRSVQQTTTGVSPSGNTQPDRRLRASRVRWSVELAGSGWSGRRSLSISRPVANQPLDVGGRWSCTYSLSSAGALSIQCSRPGASAGTIAHCNEGETLRLSIVDTTDVGAVMRVFVGTCLRL